MDRKLFLFGTGQISKNYTENLNQLSIIIDGYVDNDSKKWGTYFQNQKIYNPDVLKQLPEVEILIACADIANITVQLIQMGVNNRVISIDHLVKTKFDKIRNNKQHTKNIKIRNLKNKRIIIDDINGSWGGAEDWAHKITISLAYRGYKMSVIENSEVKRKKNIEKYIKRIDRKGKGFYAIYTELIEYMMQIKPFILINIWNLEVLWAACYIKKLYPDEVAIISTLLNDRHELYEYQREWDDYIDLYLCISSRINNNLIKFYGIDKKKVFFREPFVEGIQNNKREYQINHDMPLKICYPCRLVRDQKRADLLLELVENLEKTCINYILDIAGDGPYERKIWKYVNDNKLFNKIKLYGRLSREDLIELLSKEDIYLNLSDFEGTSLTMLEAMASGCVPVVTDVSGVNDFIINMENGLISQIGDIKGIVENIIFLNNNRTKLKEFGLRSSKIVYEKCNFDEYIDYIEKLVNSL